MTTPTDSKKWDVAISFLIQDISIAEALYTELSKGLKVFFSPRRQEEIAGTDGMEIFRMTFLNDSRLNVVVYRERWGTTPWTAVEAHAIRDSCVQNQFRNIFVFNVEKARVFPPWLPHNHMRFDLGEYTLDQVVGAIKLRVAEQGGQYEPMTPQKQAQVMKAEQEYEWERACVRSIDHLPKIKAELERLFQTIEGSCLRIRNDGSIDLECEVNGSDACIMRCEQMGMIVRWHQPYGNVLHDSSLYVESYSGHLWFNRESRAGVHFHMPELLSRIEYDPDLSRSRELGWRLSKRSAQFLTSETLAQNAMMDFLKLVASQRAGTT
jgi:hypothetical protein